MMTIDEEIAHLITFLKHPAGFDVGMGATLSIRPIDEGSPPTSWEVEWEITEGDITYDYHRDFCSLEEACTFYVEKRRFLCWGLDFEKLLMTGDEID